MLGLSGKPMDPVRIRRRRWLIFRRCNDRLACAHPRPLRSRNGNLRDAIGEREAIGRADSALAWLGSDAVVGDGETRAHRASYGMISLGSFWWLGCAAITSNVAWRGSSLKRVRLSATRLRGHAELPGCLRRKSKNTVLRTGWSRRVGAAAGEAPESAARWARVWIWAGPVRLIPG